MWRSAARKSWVGEQNLLPGVQHCHDGLGHALPLDSETTKCGCAHLPRFHTLPVFVAGTVARTPLRCADPRRALPRTPYGSIAGGDGAARGIPHP